MVKGFLDFFVVCTRIISLITGMEIYDMKKNIPTNFTQVQKGGRVLDSDHVPLELTLNMKILPTRPTREIIYNFKNKNGRNLFQQMISDTYGSIHPGRRMTPKIWEFFSTVRFIYH